MAKNSEIEGLKNTLIDLHKKIEDIENGVGNRIKEKAVETQKKVGNKIEENPFRSVGMAFGAGMLTGVAVSMVMKRR